MAQYGDCVKGFVCDHRRFAYNIQSHPKYKVFQPLLLCRGPWCIPIYNIHNKLKSILYNNI